MFHLHSVRFVSTALGAPCSSLCLCGEPINMDGLPTWKSKHGGTNRTPGTEQEASERTKNDIARQRKRTETWFYEETASVCFTPIITNI